jgi:membrane protein implicated in regulation of membrane protease activity
MPHLDEQQLDLVGLGLVALAAFFAPVFYLGWDGGKVGEALASGFVFLLGGVAYLVPIALFAALVVALGFGLRRWRRRDPPTGPQSPELSDADAQRIDAELALFDR